MDRTSEKELQPIGIGENPTTMQNTTEGYMEKSRTTRRTPKVYEEKEEEKENLNGMTVKITII